MKYYTVYLNSTDEIVAAGTARECAKKMNRSVESFYCSVGRTRSGKHKKYTIIEENMNAQDDEE